VVGDATLLVILPVIECPAGVLPPGIMKRKSGSISAMSVGIAKSETVPKLQVEHTEQLELKDVEELPVVVALPCFVPDGSPAVEGLPSGPIVRGG
jgi:hypothetical protein